MSSRAMRVDDRSTTARIFRSALAVGLGLLVAGVVVACGSKPLPEAESAAAKTYVATCAGCHVLYPPSMLTAGMWRTVVDRMDREMARRGRPMATDTRAEVLAYLQRNAGER